MPWITALALGYVSVTYFMFGFKSDASVFFEYWFGHVLIGIYFSTLAQFYAPLLPSPAVASILAGVTTSFVILFSGVFLSVSDLRGNAAGLGWAFMYYLDGLAHILRLEALPVFFCAGADCPTVNIVAPDGTQQQLFTYDYVSGRLGMTYERRWEALGWTVLIIAFFRVLSILAYRKVNHTRR